MARRNKFYEGIRDALVEGIDALRHGRELTRREVAVVPAPCPMKADELIALRKERMGVSQHIFAGLLNVAPATVQAWEQGRNTPAGATLRLLRLAESSPSMLTKMMKSSGSPPLIVRRKGQLRTTRAKGIRRPVAQP
jgi:putative transcriptional regulator